MNECGICQVSGQSQGASVMKEWDPFQSLGKESARVVMLLTRQTVISEFLYIQYIYVSM